MYSGSGREALREQVGAGVDIVDRKRDSAAVAGVGRDRADELFVQEQVKGWHGRLRRST